MYSYEYVAFLQNSTQPALVLTSYPLIIPPSLPPIIKTLVITPQPHPIIFPEQTPSDPPTPPNPDQRPRPGKTVAENLAAAPELKAGQDVILPIESPIKPEARARGRLLLAGRGG